MDAAAEPSCVACILIPLHSAEHPIGDWRRDGIKNQRTARGEVLLTGRETETI